MNNFDYARATDVADAVRRIAADKGARFVAGGTNLIDLMKEGVARPSRLIDITHLPLDRVEESADGGLRIGALVRNSDLAYHPQIEARYPLLASALLDQVDQVGTAGDEARVRVGGDLAHRVGHFRGARVIEIVHRAAPPGRAPPFASTSSIAARIAV